MFPFFSHTKEGRQSIILDIQSGLVRGALVSRDIDGSAHILSVVTRSIPSKTHIANGSHLMKRVLKLVSEVIEHLAKDAPRVSEIHYILSSPWISSQLKTIKIDYKKETAIDSGVLADLIKGELKQDMGEDAQAVEQKIFEIKLNGYTTAYFDSKRAHMLELSLATSFASTSFLSKLHSVVQGRLDIRSFTHNSALLMQYAALREILDDKHEYIYIHVHGELTDVVIVKNNLCRHLASFPFGISALQRKIASLTNQGIESSDSLLSLYQGDKLSEAEKSSVQKAVTPLLQEWADSCIKSFVSKFDSTSIPRTVYLAAHSHFDLFKDALLFRPDLSLSIIPYDSVSKPGKITFEKGSSQSTMMQMYTLALGTVL
ncbi:MAG: hypothetical protein AAB610_01925 [Patescibacteria group bacterium]